MAVIPVSVSMKRSIFESLDISLIKQPIVLHSYIPVGLLERLPQRINERPPPYYGRNDLETLLSSSDCADWVKIR